MGEEQTNLIEFPKFKYGYFRLFFKNQDLQARITTLLKIGLDPYFPKYSKSELRDTKITGIWLTLIKRMQKDHISFLDALITEPTAKF